MHTQKNRVAVKRVHFSVFGDPVLEVKKGGQPYDNPYSSPPALPRTKKCEVKVEAASPPRVKNQVGKDLAIAAVIAIVGACVALYLASYQHQSVSTFVMGYLAGTVVSFQIALHRIWSAIMKQKWGIGGSDEAAR